MAAGGCGAEDFPNEPRPASPIEISARVNGNKVIVAPNEVGAGLANVTISNQSDEEVAVSFSGPNESITPPITAGGVGVVKLELRQGDYSVDADSTSINAGNLSVGAPRPSAQNDLLLP